MSTIEKSISTTISMIVLFLSLAVVSPTTANGKGNKRTGNVSKSQVGTKLKMRNVSPSGTGLRSATSGARSGLMFHGTNGTGEKFTGRTNPRLLGTGAGEIFF